jgi:glycerate kinase
MQVLIAPDKFKGTLTSVQAALAMADGARSVHPSVEVIVMPLADGGDGTLATLLHGLGGREHEVATTDGSGGAISSTYAELDDGRYVIEMARASGLAGYKTRPLDPLSASSFGTGRVIDAAARRAQDRRTTIVGVGGSASTDGGTGAASAIGWRFLDDRGNELPPGGAALRELAHIIGDHVLPPVSNLTIAGACDVTNPLLGPHGAARTFAPQKGASADQVEILEEAMDRLATVMARDLGVYVGDARHAGAGGGMGAGLVAFFSATLESGFEVVAGAVGLREAIARADVVVTGEGKLDAQSWSGKVPGEVARMCRENDTPCLAVVGDVESGTSAPGEVAFATVRSLVADCGRERAMSDAGACVTDATRSAVGGTLHG